MITKLTAITDPVLVTSTVLDPGRLPDWQDMLNTLPVGVGLKGGIARKILKVISGLNHQHPDFAKEMNGDGDIDILIAVPEVTPKLRRSLRQEFNGQTFGNMTITAKDIEVSDSLSKYFLTRDVTMNEALVFRASEDEIVLYYTVDAANDVAEGVIRPSIHCLHTGYSQVWQYDSYNNVIPSAKIMARCIIRWLKGHGESYAIAPHVWQYYREKGLTLTDYFRIMRNFVENDDKFKRCHRHLVDLGLLHPDKDPNLLWGESIAETNKRLARHGKRLTFSEPDVSTTECWITHKEIEYTEWMMKRETLRALGQSVEPDEEAQVYLPDGLTNFPACYKVRENICDQTTEECVELQRRSIGSLLAPLIRNFLRRC